MTKTRNIRKPLLALGLGVALTASLLTVTPQTADAASKKPEVQKTRSAKVDKVKYVKKNIKDTSRAAAKKTPPKAEWPKAGESGGLTVDKAWVDDPGTGVAVRSEQPDKAPARIVVEVLGRSVQTTATGAGLVFEITPTDEKDAEPPASAPAPSAEPSPDVSSASPESASTAKPTEPTVTPSEPTTTDPKITDDFTAPVEIKIDYSDYAAAYGGDWSHRLRLVQVDDCKTTKADNVACNSSQPLASTNDTEKKTVTATVPAKTLASGSATTMALAAGDSGDQGDFAATPLSAASSWSSGGQTGDFNWSYPIGTPGGINGPEPDLSINYSSGSVDGRTSATNNQTSWVGEGFSLDPGFVERSYVPCQDDKDDSNAPSTSRDLCWRDDNITVSIGGKSSKIIRIGSSNLWRMKEDDGTRIERKTGGPNRDDNGEYWLITTTDGTRLYFGRTKRFDGDTANTDSVSRVPVYGNQSGEPCHDSSFTDSDCNQAWRWGLDYVVDTHGNTMSMFYDQETNKYGGRNNADIDEYDRGQILKRIEYGTKFGTENDSSAPVRVTFDTAERCIATETKPCDELKESTADRWPDVPYDRICTSDSSCSDRISPSFFSRKRLTSITTETWDSGDSTYKPVTGWSLKQSFPDAGDGTAASLWLDQITQTGKVGGDVSLPPVKFYGQQRANRVDKLGDGLDPFIKWRVMGIENGVGGVTSVQYSGEDCTYNSKPSSSALDTNTRLCFPSYYQPELEPDPQLEFFHKYVVNSVTESDGTGHAPDVVTGYTYTGTPAWHYDNNTILRKKHRTWSDWRGYGKVTTRVGNAGDGQTNTETLYLRGMDGDKKQAGGTKSVTVTDSDSPDIVDKGYYNGFERRTKTTLGAAGEVVDIDVNTPWASAATATDSDEEARIVDVGVAENRTRLSSGSYRTTKSTTSFNTNGQQTQVEDEGDTAVSTDNQCTKTSYAENTAEWILELPSQETTTVGACSANPATADDVIEASRTFYDGGALGAAPTAGDVTKTESASGFSAGIDYQTDSTVTYDSYGRAISEKNALDETTTTNYEPNTGLPTTVVETNPLDQATTTTLNRTWGSPEQIIDVRGGKTDYEYDALGRVAKTWIPGREKSTGSTPSYKYAYSVSATEANVVTSEKLQYAGASTSTYVTTHQFYDGLLRERGTQTPSAGRSANGSGGGRLITEKIYDSRGWVQSDRGPTYNNEEVAPTLVTSAENQTAAYTNYQYDLAGRPTVESFLSRGIEKSKTTTTYGGDRVSVKPPTGGTATTTISGARDQTTKLMQYTGADPSGTADETAYTYTPAGELKTIVNAAGNKWTNTYDIRGRLTKAEDPDRGTSTTTYDVLDRQKTTKDAKNQVLWTKYDALGRKVELRNTDADGSKRSSWTYDTVKPGLLTSSTRYVGSDEYTSSIESYDDAGRPVTTKVMIPASEGALSKPAGYVHTNTYLAGGLVAKTTQPFAPGLATESINYSYDLLGNPNTGQGVPGTTYSPYGDVLQRTLGEGIGKFVYDTRDYEDGTRRLKQHTVDTATGTTGSALDLRYSYDQAGNVTALNDVAPADTNQTSAATDRQCFKYDHLRRMTQAWSSSTTTCAAASDSTLGSVAPYWDTFTFDKSGNRTKWVAKTKPSTSVKTLTHTYTVPSGTSAQPHATTKDTAAGTGAYTESFTYDANGSMASRSKSSSVGQTITWDAEGHQASVTDKATSKKTEYLYDADGNRLIERDATAGSTTLYVGNTEYILKAGALTANRNYTLGGEPSLTRSSGGVNKVVIGDAQSTGMLQIDTVTQAVTKRRFTPFGAPRVDNTAWIGGRGFLNQPADPTGTTHLGAREYDANLGRFLSVDPILDPMDPQQANGYSYGNNAPMTFTDADGLDPQCMNCGASYYKGIRDGYRHAAKYKPRYAKRPVWRFKARPAKAKAAPKGFGYMGGAYASNAGAKQKSTYDSYSYTSRPGNSGVTKMAQSFFRNILFDDRSCRGGVDFGCGAEIAMIIPFLKIGKIGKLADDAKEAAQGSDLFKPGPWAKDSIPARNQGQTFLSSERDSINSFGNSGGCHSCGIRNPGTKSGNFVPDHQPPSRWVDFATPQRLYPQCISCSRSQGLEIAKVLRGRVQ